MSRKPAKRTRSERQARRARSEAKPSGGGPLQDGPSEVQEPERERSASARPGKSRLAESEALEANEARGIALVVVGLGARVFEGHELGLVEGRR